MKPLTMNSSMIARRSVVPLLLLSFNAISFAYDSDVVEDRTERDEQKYPDSTYCAYFRHALLHGPEVNLPKGKDNVITFIDEYAACRAGQHSYEEAARQIVKFSSPLRTMFHVCECIYKDKETSDTWTKANGDDPPLEFTKGLVNSLTPRSKNSFGLFVRLMEEADGYYAEAMWGYLRLLLIQKPAVVFKHIEDLEKQKDFIYGAVCVDGREEERKNIIQLYQQSRNKNAKTVLSWIQCKPEDI